MKTTKKKLSAQQQKELIATLKTRFEKNKNRHKGMEWDKVEARLEDHPAKLWSLGEMEATGGEPDVVDFDKKTGEFIFMDCSAESPKERRSLCYDRAAHNSRKENKPAGCAMDMAAAMGIEVLNEEQYRQLQELGEFDLKTSSWIVTPVNIRKLGGALFCDRRYNTVFVYHNGAESYYAARGFRGLLKVWRVNVKRKLAAETAFSLTEGEQRMEVSVMFNVPPASFIHPAMPNPAKEKTVVKAGDEKAEVDCSNLSYGIYQATPYVNGVSQSVQKPVVSK